MIVQATGAPGAPTNVTATNVGISTMKREFVFREAHADYRLRDIRVVTDPPAARGGYLDPDRR
jgi:hypothetical protein